jgi:hypothetical protein
LLAASVAALRLFYLRVRQAHGQQQRHSNGNDAIHSQFSFVV